MNKFILTYISHFLSFQQHSFLHLIDTIEEKNVKFRELYENNVMPASNYKLIK